MDIGIGMGICIIGMGIGCGVGSVRSGAANGACDLARSGGSRVFEGSVEALSRVHASRVSGAGYNEPKRVDTGGRDCNRKGIYGN